MAVAFAYLISFSMAFLLFVVQPMATKVILPQFGGTPAVWNTAMLFFQTLLLVGYLYAHLLSSYLKPRWQIIAHGVLILLACAALPVLFVAPSPEVLSHTPIRALIWELFEGVGIPFFCVSATAPLLQRWISYSNTSLATKPYVLYSASNFGSMSALIGYILLIEPNAPVSIQMQSWGYGFAAVSLALILYAYRISGKAEGAKEYAIFSGVPWKQSLFWIFLAFLPSSLSLGVTTHITTDIASVPFFWVVPFAIYLLSFVDAFANRPRIVPLAKYIAPVVGVACLFALASFMIKHTEVMLLHLAAFALLAFAIHGHLADRKPEVKHLTWYYVCLSIGGALGGTLNAIIAPMLLNTTFEYPAVLFIAILTSYILFRQSSNPKFQLREEMVFLITLTLSLLAITAMVYGFYALLRGEWERMSQYLDGGVVSMGMCFAAFILLLMRRSFRTLVYGLAVTFILIYTGSSMSANSLLKERNFYGVSRVYDHYGTNARILQHNTTIHGLQSLDNEFRLAATSYYGGLHEIMAHRLPSVANAPIAAIGLGIGIVKCQTAPGQHMDIFEINPLVVKIAKDMNLFSYLADCEGTHDIVLGDGRLTMAKMQQKKYGTIIIDAFSSDAIPVHLLTKEAFEMYLDKLMPGGTIVIHITNRHLDLRPLLAVQAEATGMTAYSKFFDIEGPLNYNAFWVVLARNDATLAPLLAESDGWYRLTAGPQAKPWTDDYTNILPYLTKMR